MDSKSRIKPFSPNLKLAPRQKYKDSYNLNGSLYLASRESIINNNSFITSDTIGYIMPEEYSIDIDTPLDWEIGEFLMRRLE